MTSFFHKFCHGKFVAKTELDLLNDVICISFFVIYYLLRFFLMFDLANKNEQESSENFQILLPCVTIFFNILF